MRASTVALTFTVEKQVHACLIMINHVLKPVQIETIFDERAVHLGLKKDVNYFKIRLAWDRMRREI